MIGLRFMPFIRSNTWAGYGSSLISWQRATPGKSYRLPRFLHGSERPPRAGRRFGGRGMMAAALRAAPVNADVDQAAHPRCAQRVAGPTGLARPACAVGRHVRRFGGELFALLRRR